MVNCVILNNTDEKMIRLTITLYVATLYMNAKYAFSCGHPIGYSVVKCKTDGPCRKEQRHSSFFYSHYFKNLLKKFRKSNVFLSCICLSSHRRLHMSYRHKKARYIGSSALLVHQVYYINNNNNNNNNCLIFAR
jgi:L-ribulose-5-phosphate 3-epimerase UlaE